MTTTASTPRLASRCSGTENGPIVDLGGLERSVGGLERLIDDRDRA